MSKPHVSHFAMVNGINMHYLDYASEGPPLLLLHSLTANAQVFHGLIANGLDRRFRLILPDLRGRGASPQVPEDYSLETQAKDLIGLLDHLQIERAHIVGHSFGGFLALYFAAHYPDRVSGLGLLDAAIELNPLTPALITTSVARLLSAYPSWDAYLAVVHQAPFMNRWDAAMVPFLRQDVQELEGGGLVPAVHIIDAVKAGTSILAYSRNEWRSFAARVRCKAILVQATEPFVYGQFIVEPHQAIRTVAVLPKGHHYKAEGNHFTMLFGKGAQHINAAICQLTHTAHKKSRAVVAG